MPLKGRSGAIVAILLSGPRDGIGFGINGSRLGNHLTTK